MSVVWYLAGFVTGLITTVALVVGAAMHGNAAMPDHEDDQIEDRN